MIKVEYEVPEYEVDDKIITVKSHWSRPSLVVIVINGIEHVFNARELKSAIDNATHTCRY